MEGQKERPERTFSLNLMLGLGLESLHMLEVLHLRCVCLKEILMNLQVAPCLQNKADL